VRIGTRRTLLPAPTSISDAPVRIEADGRLRHGRRALLHLAELGGAEAADALARVPGTAARGPAEPGLRIHHRADQAHIAGDDRAGRQATCARSPGRICGRAASVTSASSSISPPRAMRKVRLAAGPEMSPGRTVRSSTSPLTGRPDVQAVAPGLQLRELRLRRGDARSGAFGAEPPLLHRLSRQDAFGVEAADALRFPLGLLRGHPLLLQLSIQLPDLRPQQGVVEHHQRLAALTRCPSSASTRAIR
jgi:hypothetical protein